MPTTHGNLQEASQFRKKLCCLVAQLEVKSGKYEPYTLAILQFKTLNFFSLQLKQDAYLTGLLLMAYIYAIVRQLTDDVAVWQNIAKDTSRV